MQILVRILLMSSMLFIACPALAQKNKHKAPKDPQKEALKKEEKEAKQLEKDIKRLKKEHAKLQGKKTVKRMKRNRKRSSRHAHNKKDPFLQRLFQGKGKKKGKKLKEVP